MGGVREKKPPSESKGKKPLVEKLPEKGRERSTFKEPRMFKGQHPNKHTGGNYLTPEQRAGDLFQGQNFDLGKVRTPDGKKRVRGGSTGKGTAWNQKPVDVLQDRYRGWVSKVAGENWGGKKAIDL